MKELQDFLSQINPENLDGYLKTIVSGTKSAIEAIEKFQGKADTLKQTTEVELAGLIKAVEQKKIEYQAMGDAHVEFITHAENRVKEANEIVGSRKAEIKKLDLTIAGISSVVKILTAEKFGLLQKLGRIKDEMHKTITKR